LPVPRIVRELHWSARAPCPSQVAVEPRDRDSVDRRQLRGWIRRRRVPKIADVELLRAGEPLVRRLRLVDVEGEVVAALHQQRRRRDRRQLRGDRARGRYGREGGEVALQQRRLRGEERRVPTRRRDCEREQLDEDRLREPVRRE